MKVSDLRIGNLFLGEPISHDAMPKEEMIVKKIETYQGQDLINGFWWGTGDYCGYSIEDVEPIPLTEEWLKRFGFEKTIADDVNHHFDYYTDEKISAGNLWEHDKGFCHDYDMGGEIKHVHQLQNLYHALTGEELKINQL